VSIEILPGESISSWLTRLATANGVSLQCLCWETWPGRALLTKDLDRRIPQDVSEMLEAKTGIQAGSILQTSLQGMEGSLFEDCRSGSMRVPWVLPVHLRFKREHGTQYCPECLKEDPAYFRIQWRLSFITCCEKHKSVLSDHCPSCHHALNPYACFGGYERNTGPVPVHFCRSCGWDLRNTISLTQPSAFAVSEEILAFQTILVEAVNLRWIQPKAGYQIHALPWFHGLRCLVRHLTSRGPTKRMRWGVLNELGLQPDPSFEESIECFQLFEQLSVRFRYQTMVMLQWILEDWPEKYIRICKWASLRFARLSQDSSREYPYWLWSVNREHLSMKHQTWRKALLPSGLTISYKDLGERVTRQSSILWEKRRQFIRDHPELHFDQRRLLKEMGDAGLYSPNSEPSTLLKHIDSVIRDSGKRPSLIEIINSTK